MNGARLAEIDRLVARRRPRVVPPLVLLAVAAVVVTAGVVWAGVNFWFACVFCGAAWIVAGAPWRMFWRPDSAFLGRLPIAGTALYHLGTWRTLSAAWPVAVVVAVAALGLRAPVPMLLRQLAFEAVLFGAAVLLAPATGALAGALVVSSQSQALVTNATGQTIPPTSFLSMVPGVGGALLVYAGFIGTSWIAGDHLLVVVPLAVALVAAAGAWLAARPMAAQSLASATRIVAALDAVRLAHVDLSRARGLERAAGRVLGRAGRLVYEKDVALSRRRNPGYYIVTGLLLLGLWIVAFAASEPRRTELVIGGAALAGAYTLVFARRLVAPPVEHVRLLHTLPLGDGHVRAAKRLSVVWRALVVVGAASAPALVRASDPVLLGGVLGGIFIVVAVAGSLLAPYGRPTIL